MKALARYPGIGMSFLARNFAPIEVSYLFAGISCILGSIFLLLLLSFSSSLSFVSFQPLTRVFIYIFLLFSLSFDEIIHFLETLSSSLSLFYFSNNFDLTSKQIKITLKNISTAISCRDTQCDSAFIHRLTE